MLKNENVYKKAVLIMFSFLDVVVSLAPPPWFGQQITSIIQSHFPQLCFDWYLEMRWNGLIQQKIQKMLGLNLLDLKFTRLLHLLSFILLPTFITDSSYGKYNTKSFVSYKSKSKYSIDIGTDNKSKCSVDYKSKYLLITNRTDFNHPCPSLKPACGISPASPILAP